MTLVKLDSDDYINTDKINRVYTTECMDLLGDRGIHDEIHASFDSGFVEITPADRDRIVEAMGGNDDDDTLVIYNSGKPYMALIDGKDYHLVRVHHEYD